MNFNSNQEAAIQHMQGPCCVIAGAGSGKTAVLINRIVNLINAGVDPKRILAVTFSKKATLEMKERLEFAVGCNDVKISTFHSLGYYILKNDPAGFLKGRDPIKEFEKIAFIEKAIKGTILEEQDAAPAFISAFIGLCKSSLINTETVKTGSYIQPELIAMYDVWRKYEAHKEAEGLYDYSDMEDKPVFLMRDNHMFRERMRSRWEYILVDEYQDTSKAQNEILRLIQPRTGSVFVVGDDFQAIYGFRGSEVKNILDFPYNFPGARIIYLDINYRSTGEIIKAANTLIAHNVFQFKKNVQSGRNTAGEMPTFTIYEDESVEAEAIGHRILTLVTNGGSFKDTAVLYRTNFKSRAFEEAFLNMGIPFKVQGGTRFFERRYVSDVLDYLRLAVDPDNSSALLNVLNRPNRYFGTVFREAMDDYMKKTGASAFIALSGNNKAKEWRFSKYIDQLSTHILWMNKNRKLNAKLLVEYVYNTIGYKDFLKKDASDELFEERLEDMEELLELAGKFESADDFVKHIDTQIAASVNFEEVDDAVTLATVHKVKGLEFPNVFIVSCNEELFPHKRSDDLEEERRIMYVAMTRAKDYLGISAVNYFRYQKARVSRFVEEIENDIFSENVVHIRKNRAGGLLPPKGLGRESWEGSELP